MRLRQITALLCLLAAAAFAAGCGGSDSDTGGSDAFRLGLEAPLSGEQSVLGEGMLKGAELAATQLNAEDGILASRSRSCRSTTPPTRQRGRRRRRPRSTTGLDGIVGPYNSGRRDRDPAALHQGRPGADQAHLGHLDQRPGLHPAADDLPDRAGCLAGADRLARSQDGRDRLRPDPELHRHGLQGAEEARSRMPASTVTAYEKVQPGEKYYSRRRRQTRRGRPDVIYAAVYFPEGGLIAKQMHEGEVESQCVADYASYDTGFVETAGVARGASLPGGRRAGARRLLRRAANVGRIPRDFDEDPGTWSPYTYDSVNFLADGAEKAGGTDAEQAHQGARRGRGLEGLDRLGHDRSRQRQPPAGDRGHRRHRPEGKAPRRRGLGEGRRRPVPAQSIDPSVGVV